MQALCRSYLRGFPELKNCRNPQQKATTTFLAAMKVFSYLFVPLPIAAFAILATYKIFSKKPPNGGTTDKTAKVAVQTLPPQRDAKEGEEGTNNSLSTGAETPVNTATATTTTTTTATTTTTTTTTTTATATATTTPPQPIHSTPPLSPSLPPLTPPPHILPSASIPNPQSVPKPVRQQTPAVQVTPPTAEELRQKTIMDAVQAAKSRGATITINFISNGFLYNRTTRTNIKLKNGMPFDLSNIFLDTQTNSLKQPVTYIVGNDYEAYLISVPLTNVKSVSEKIA